MITSFTVIILTLIALCSFLAFKFHKADKAVDKLSGQVRFQPFGLDNIVEGLKEKGCTIENCDEKEQTISFQLKDIRYHLDISRRPITFLHTGFGTEEDTDMDCLKKALDKTSEDIVMVKGNLYEDGYSFLLTSCEQNTGHFMACLDKYVEIIDDALRCVGTYYHEFIGEKRGREQAIEEIQGPAKMMTESEQMENKILS